MEHSTFSRQTATLHLNGDNKMQRAPHSFRVFLIRLLLATAFLAFPVNPAINSHILHIVQAAPSTFSNTPDSSVSSRLASDTTPPEQVYIDGPVAGATISGTLTIVGWANDSGSDISRIEIYVAGNFVEIATYGLWRADLGRNLGYQWSGDSKQFGGGQHTIMVRAIDNAGNHTDASRYIIIQAVNAPPNYPIATSPASGAWLKTSSVALAWQDGGDPDNWPRSYRDYSVQVATDSGFTNLVAGAGYEWWHSSQPLLLNTTWTTPPLAVGGPYYWRLLAGDGTGSSGWSSARLFYIDTAHNVNWLSDTMPQSVFASTNFSITVHVSNTGTDRWLAGGTNPTHLSYHWLDSNGKDMSPNPVRTTLPYDISPNGDITLSAILATPDMPGNYTLKWDFIQEYTAWFSQLGVPTRDIAVRVAAYINSSSSVSLISPFHSNDVVTFTLALTNSSGVDLQNVIITDVLPARFTFQQVLSGLQPSNTQNGQVVWASQIVPAGSTFTIQFNSTAYQVAGTFVNTVQASNNSQTAPAVTAAVYINVTPTPTPLGPTSTPSTTPTPTPTPTNTPPPPATPSATPPPAPTYTPTAPPQPLPTSTPIPTPTPNIVKGGYTGGGIYGTYYTDPISSTFTTYWKNQLDPVIDFGIRGATGYWSARWQSSGSVGYLAVPQDGVYTFYTSHVDDGVRLWVDGILLIDQWHPNDNRDFHENKTLTRGNHIIRVDYFQNPLNNEGLRVGWSGPGFTTEQAIAPATIVPPPPTPAYDAQYNTQSVPTTMVAGEQYSVSVTFKNTGSNTWTAGGSYRLGAQNPQDGWTWGLSRVYLGPTDSIGLSQLKTFRFPVTAPPTPGTYNFQWRMLQDAAAWFGDYTKNVVVTVIPPSPLLGVIKTSPINGQTGVPAAAWMSAVFNTDLDPRTVNTNTVRLADSNGYPIQGRVEYISSTRTVFFEPSAPLPWAGWMYSATLSSGIAWPDGRHLAQDYTWSFTTATGTLSAGDKHVLYGDLHSHTGYSDGKGTPADAFTTGRANGLDFLAVTDHSEQLTLDKWSSALSQALSSTVDGQFVAVRGFEWTNGSVGHINVLGTSNYVSVNDPSYNTLDKMYTWLADPARAGAVAQFNHPNIPANSFNNLALNYPADAVIKLIEVGNGNYDQSANYPKALGQGWHVAPTYNSDTHATDWGQPAYRTGVLADSLTYDGLMEALRARRVFTTKDRNALLTLKVNDAWMGSVVGNGPAYFQVHAENFYSNKTFTWLELYENGVKVDGFSPNKNVVDWKFSRTTITGTLTNWYIHAIESDGSDLFTAPVWTHLGAPVVGDMQPIPGAQNVPLDSSISFAFNPDQYWMAQMAIDAQTVNSRTVLLYSDTMPVTGTLVNKQSNGVWTWHFYPGTPLDPNTTYTVKLSADIRGGDAPYVHIMPTTWSFKTIGTPRDQLVVALQKLRDAFDHIMAENSSYAADVVNLTGDALPGSQIDLVDQAKSTFLSTILAAAEKYADPKSDPYVSLEMGFGTSLATAFGFEWNQRLGRTWIMNATGSAYGDLVHDLAANSADVLAVRGMLNARMPIPRYRDGNASPTQGFTSLRASIRSDFDNLVVNLPQQIPNTPRVQEMIKRVGALTIDLYQTSKAVRQLSWEGYGPVGGVKYHTASTGMVARDRKSLITLYEQHADAQLRAAWVDAIVTVAATSVGAATILVGGATIPIVIKMGTDSLGVLEIGNVVGKGMLIDQEQVIASLMVDTIIDLQLESADIWAAADDTLAYVSVVSTNPNLQTQSAQSKPLTLQQLESASFAGAQAASLVVDSFQIPNVTLSGGEWGTAIGALTVTNPNSYSIAMALQVEVATYDGNNARIIHTGSIDEGDYITLTAGARRLITFTLSLPRSSMWGGPAGYDALANLYVADPDSGQAYVQGPYWSHFYVEPPELMAHLVGQKAGLIATGAMQPGETDVFTVTAPVDTDEVWIKLVKDNGDDIDLHAYDTSGSHVGANYIDGSAETQIPGSVYSGSDSPLEWIRIPHAGGQSYVIQLYAYHARSNARYLLSTFERKLQPAILYTPGAVAALTASRSVTISVDMQEVGWVTPIGDMAVTVTDFGDNHGHNVPSTTVGVQPLWPVLWSGESSHVILTTTIPAGTPDGIYSGTVNIAGKDAGDMHSMTASVGALILYDTTPPTSTVSALSEYVSSSFTVTWTGGDALAGVASYDIQVLDSLTGTWTYWLTGTMAPAAAYDGMDGHTYTFRSRARDLAGNTQDWPVILEAQAIVDASAPSSSVAELPVYQNKSNFNVSWQGQDTASDVASYDIQVRDGLSGSWSIWLTGTTKLSSLFTGQDGHIYAFRCRATDNVGNIEGWPSIPDVQTIIDTIPPTSTMQLLPPYENNLSFAVSWRGQDATSGVASYDIQVRDGASGTWYAWLTGTTTLSETFTGQDGHIYAFRSRGTDNARNTAAWLTTPDAQTTIDASAPTSLVNNLPNYQTAQTFTVTWCGQDTVSGIASYDVQVKDGLSSTWMGWLTSTLVSSARFSGLDGHSYAFHTRATDAAGNTSAWGIPGTTIVDASAPTVTMYNLSATQTITAISVHWSGNDATSGLASYDVQARIDGGAWTNWLIRTVVTSSTFSGVYRHTFGFRVLATDYAGNISAWSTAVSTALYDPTIAEFNAEPTSGVRPLTVTFTDASSGIINSWLWDFGDGSASIEQNPTHVYAAASVYTVSLRVNGPGGADTRVWPAYIVVNEWKPVAAFNATPLAGSRPLTVAFTDASTGAVNSWLWYFGDGAVGSEQHVDHTYQAAGSYTVSLKVNGPGGKDTVTRTNFIVVNESAPVADFTSGPCDGVRPLRVVFTDTTVGLTNQWQWDFGDGASASEQNPIHTYQSAGDFTVILIASGPGGSDVILKRDYIRVEEPHPVAGFMAGPLSGTRPLTVAFTDTSSGIIYSWLWDFGDGSASSLENPSHTYVTAGVYTVSLSASGPFGVGTLTEASYITVTEPLPVAGFSATPVNGVRPLDVVFTDTTHGMVSSWLWDFGDGNNSATSNPSHTYTAVGVYTVILMVSGPGGADAITRTNAITVSEPPPVAGFVASPTSGVRPLTVDFTDTSSGVVTSWLWDFGDGVTSTVRSISHTYTVAGVYIVSLTASGPGGSNTSTQPNYITVNEQPPVAGFTAAPTSGVRPLTVVFTNTSIGPVTTWLWDFGDRLTNTEQSPTHTYTMADIYTVSLTLSGPGGSNSYTQTNLISVGEMQFANFNASPRSGLLPLTIYFTDISTGSITAWLWDFGDTITNTYQNPSHVYTHTGMFTVSLQVNGDGTNSSMVRADYIRVYSLIVYLPIVMR